MAFHIVNDMILSEDEFEYMTFMEAMQEAEAKRKLYAIMGFLLAIFIGVAVSLFFNIAFWITIPIGIFLGLVFNIVFSILFKILLWILIIGFLVSIFIQDIKWDFIFESLSKLG